MRTARLLVCLLGLGPGIAMVGCASLEDFIATRGDRDVHLATLDDFVRSPDHDRPPPPESIDPAPTSAQGEPSDPTVAAGSDGAGKTGTPQPNATAPDHDTSTSADAAATASDEASTGGLRLGSASPPRDDVTGGPMQAAARTEQRMIVDSLIGEIHGRPIFADTFFEPIEDRLRAEARKAATSRQFSSTALNIITQRLRELMVNELVLAEAESSLTQQEQQGLIPWMREIRERITAGAGGSEYLARRRIAEERGMSLEQLTQQMRDQQLVQRMVQQEIQPRVIVSWRDVRREYQRQYERFNPSPTMTVGRIRLSTEREAEKIQQVNNRLADGLPFAEIASIVGQPNAANWQQFELPPGGIDELGLNEVIRNKLKDLDVGETSEPFQIGSSTWWLHITNLEQPPGRSLYDPDVQRLLTEEIRRRRQNVEQERYLQQLFSEGITDDFETMVRRLVNIAERRYGP